MPPSTRAGQAGDDDQVTTGNGPEEGWLTQVVRILQLENPALPAEEAIVWAMGLVSINNQAPRRETEKILKDISSSIVHIKKLNNSNWHTWEPTFIDCLQRVHNPKEILYSTIAPGNEDYDEDLDKALVGLIHACCDNSPDSCIDTYTVRGADEKVQLGSTLYAKLRKALTLNVAVKRAGLQDHIHTVRLHNWDVVKLGKGLDSIWNDAACLGKCFYEDLKKSTLYRCTAQDWFYTNSIDTLKTARPNCKYDEAYHALAKKQQDGEISGHIRGAARVATGTGQSDASQAMQAPKGRCDPCKPIAPPKCYACGEPNHIACNCTSSNISHNPVMGLNAQVARRLLAWSECSLHGDHGHGGLGPYARRSKHHHNEDRAQGACRRLPLRGSRDKSQRNCHWSKEEEQCIRDRQVGPEEEEQCRRSRHSSGGQEWC
ncbi:uncharacterized protein UDID_17524 [Ustilago sp. UG-2017a]|nr:uncharacterized protein UDID_17524 [Ustilago sp. UG-2017a]